MIDTDGEPFGTTLPTTGQNKQECSALKRLGLWLC
jgi:hypothetical protein